MKADIASKWTKALRGGKYIQGKGHLMTGSNTYCCLGVLCHIYAKETGDPFPVGLYLPDYIQYWAGMKSSNGRLGDEERFLSYMNDKEGKTFAEIADIIEKNVEIL